MDERVTRVKRLKTSSPKGVWGVIEGESAPITHFVLIPSSGLAEVSSTHTEKNGVESFFFRAGLFSSSLTFSPSSSPKSIDSRTRFTRIEKQRQNIYGPRSQRSRSIPWGANQIPGDLANLRDKKEED